MISKREGVDRYRGRNDPLSPSDPPIHRPIECPIASHYIAGAESGEGNPIETGFGIQHPRQPSGSPIGGSQDQALIADNHTSLRVLKRNSPQAHCTRDSLLIPGASSIGRLDDCAEISDCKKCVFVNNRKCPEVVPAIERDFPGPRIFRSGNRPCKLGCCGQRQLSGARKHPRTELVRRVCGLRDVRVSIEDLLRSPLRKADRVVASKTERIRIPLAGRVGVGIDRQADAVATYVRLHRIQERRVRSIGASRDSVRVVCGAFAALT